MESIKKPGPWNPQKATAYVGKGVLKNGGGITPVPNGPLIKKDGTSLKNGGKVSYARELASLKGRIKTTKKK